MADNYNIYCINFRATSSDINLILFRWLVQQNFVIDFIMPIPLVYYIKTSAIAPQIARSLDFMFPGGGFVVAKIDTMDIDGRFSNEQWDWFYNENSTAGVKTGPT